MTGATDSQRTSAINLLALWLKKRLTADEFQWLTAQIQESLHSNSNKALFITLGKIPRTISRADLQLDQSELEAGQALRPGWDPSHWNLSGAARILLIAEMAQARGDEFIATYREICRTADVTDYPAENFDQHRWNHMILKLLFIGSTLAPVQQLDARANPELATILCDYAHERWAAGRPVSCELWRCVGPFATGKQIDDLARALSDPDKHQQHAAAIALAQSDDPDAIKVLQTNEALNDAVIQGKLHWEGENPLPSLTDGSDNHVPMLQLTWTTCRQSSVSSVFEQDNSVFDTIAPLVLIPKNQITRSWQKLSWRFCPASR